MSLQQMYQSAHKTRRTCKLCAWYAQQSDEDKQFFDEKILENMYQLARAITLSGFPVHESTVRRHHDQCGDA